jgi:hypothetical protein
MPDSDFDFADFATVINTELVAGLHTADTLKKMLGIDTNQSVPLERLLSFVLQIAPVG